MALSTFPYERTTVRYDQATGKVFRRFYAGMKLLSPACWLRIQTIYRIRYGDCEAPPHYLHP